MYLPDPLPPIYLGVSVFHMLTIKYSLIDSFSSNFLGSSGRTFGMRPEDVCLPRRLPWGSLHPTASHSANAPTYRLNSEHSLS
ncbi:hypothetical protein M408DRAFT_333819 [Serendipita vermifera MAFF 305830]|uniref:Uncharacterized protein n=1 Tax=Serendipita vermifera MAFF 305830 TaxID=933852 RepID=A0A0C2WT87_SERVB|nr:hypothetical protein M408DRAFT_333819 [Serendipita vermifera MAFF 305830]